jgi:phage terminase large subunit-like protein
MEHLPPDRLNGLLTELALRISRNRLADYRPYPKQVEFHNAGATHRERLLMAGNQLGKTMAGAEEMAMHLCGRYPAWWQGKTFDRAPIAWAASETSEVTRDGVQRLLVGRMQDGEQAIGTGTIPGDSIIDYKRRTHGAADALEFVVVRHGGGGDVQAGTAVLGFKTYDQGRRKFQGETLQIVWLDEEPDAEIYTEALTRTNATKGIVFMTFTPLKGMSNTVKRFLLDKPEGTHVTQMTIEDAAHYTPEERAAIIASYPEHEREARTKGIPTLGSGKVYPVLEQTIRATRFPIPAHWFRIGGLDFGYDHPSAAVELAFDADNGTWYVNRCHRMTKATPVLFSAAVMPWGKAPNGTQWLPWAWPHDGNQEVGGKYGAQDTVALAELYAQAGMFMLAEHATHADGSYGVEPGIMAILDLMQTGHWKVFDDLVDWWEEFRLYHRKDGRVIRANDDLMSAMRYAYMMARFAVQPPRAVRRDSADAQRRRNWRTQ